MKFHVPSPLSNSVPLPLAIFKPKAVRASPSMSVAFASSSACVITRAPLSSAMGVRIVDTDIGASLTGVMSIIAEPATSSMPSVTMYVKLKLVSSLAAGVRFQVPSPLSTRVPVETCRLVAVSNELSISVVFVSSSA